MKNRLSNALSTEEQLLSSRVPRNGLLDHSRTAREELSPPQRLAKHPVPKFIVDHPVLSFGVALAAGISLGWWVKGS